MTVLRHLIVLLTLAVWLPAANHCLLETITFEQPDACCATETTPPVTASHECQTCSVVEETGYKVEQDYSVVAAWVPVILKFLASSINTAPPSFVPVDAPVPQTLSAAWQFSCRTALPVRSPSITS